MHWQKLLRSIRESVNEELRLRKEAEQKVALKRGFEGVRERLLPWH